MEKSNNFIKGVIWNTLGSIMYGANSFIMLALVSRIGTVEQAGHFGIAFTTAQILYIVGLFGVNFYQMTDYQEKYSFSDYAKIKVFSCTLMIIGSALVILCLHFTNKKLAYFGMLVILMIINVIGDLYQCLFFQKNRLDISGSALFYRTLWSLLAFALLLSIKQNIVLALFIQIIVNLFITSYYAIKISPKFRKSNNDNEYIKKNVWNLIVECIPLFISSFLMNIIINASKYGIEILSTDTAQGYFGMIFMPVQVISLCSLFIFKPMLNKYAELLLSVKTGAFVKLLLKQILLVILLTAICCCAAYWFGTPILGTLYNKDISTLRNALTLVVFGGGILAICQLFYCILVIMRWQNYILIIYLLAFILTIGITGVLVSEFEIIGAILSFIATHIAILLCYLYVIIKYLQRNVHA